MSLSGAGDTSRKKGMAPSEASGRRRQWLKVPVWPVMRTGGSALDSKRPPENVGEVTNVR